MQERGIVVGQPFWIENDRLCTRYLYGSELRKYLLFWDLIDYPIAPLLEKTANNSDLQFLESCGVLKRTKFELPDLKINGRVKRVGSKWVSEEPLHSSLSSSAMLSTYIDRDRLQPGYWSIAHGRSEPSYSDSVKNVVIEFELINMLPIPQRDVPLQDILEFKLKRKDELSALRSYLDEIYESVISSVDIPRAKNNAIYKLELSLKDLGLSLRDAKLRVDYSNLKAHISGNFYSLLGIILGSASFSTVIPLSPVLLGMAGAGLAMTAKITMFPNSEKVKNPLVYLSNIDRLGV